MQKCDHDCPVDVYEKRLTVPNHGGEEAEATGSDKTQNHSYGKILIVYVFHSVKILNLQHRTFNI